MTIEIKAPTGDTVRFPDGTPDNVITDVMRREYGGPATEPSKGSVAPAEPSLMDRAFGPRPAGPNPDPNATLNLSEWLFGGPELDTRRRAELERSGQGVADVIRGVNRGGTVGASEEIAAWLRSKFGDEAYDAALADENAQTEAWKRRVGLGGQIATEAAGSMALPLKAAMVGYRAMAPVGSTAARRVAALTAAGVPLNTASIYNDMENKDLTKAAGWGTATSAVFAPVASVAVTAGRGVSRLGSDVFGRLAEWLNLRRGIPVPPDSGTQRFAVRRLADAAETGGTRTPADLDAAMRANEVPHTDMALVNSSNDRVSQLALEQARLLHRPNVPQAIPGGRVVDDNIFENLQHNQSINAIGMPQSEALATRTQNDFHVPISERNPIGVEGRLNAEIERQGNRIQDLRTPVMGQNVADTPLPGFVAFLDSDPAAAAAYRRATQGVSVPGPAGIPREHLPLHGQQYERALHGWETRRDAALQAGRPFTEPPPIRITDQNVPVSVLENMMLDASSATQSQRATERSVGINLHRALTGMTERAPRGSPAFELRQANRGIAETRTTLEDRAAGRRMPTQDAGPLTSAVAETTTLPANRQTARRRGYVQGLVDEINANTDNIGSIPGRVLTNPLRRQAHDVVGRTGTAAPSAEALARELSNVGNMQDTSAGLLHASRNRRTGGSLPEQVARAYAGWNFSPTVGVTRAVVTWLGGMTQARRGEIARLLVDTTGEGRDLLDRELTRRMGGYSRMNADNRRAIVLELARQLSEGSAEVLGVGRN